MSYSPRYLVYGPMMDEPFEFNGPKPGYMGTGTTFPFPQNTFSEPTFRGQRVSFDRGLSGAHVDVETQGS